MTDDRTDRAVARLRPAVDASFDPAAPAARELRSMITTHTQEATVPMPPRTRRLLIAAPITGALALGAVAATVLLSPSEDGTGLGPSTADAAVLDISVDDGLVVAEVLDPTADAERYAAEFAEHGLDVDLRFVPASPTLEGTLVYMDGDTAGEETDNRQVEVIESSECTIVSGGACPVGVKIPQDYADPIELVFGRKAQPDEQYDSSNAPTEAGEALEGVDLSDMSVGELRTTLAEIDQEIVEYRQDPTSESGEVRTPGATRSVTSGSWTTSSCGGPARSWPS
ncbi:hypothetical protein BJF83_15900 [Nocardiopsis sp. CNR-923]|nr:hypothetical protein BJF83_15900 [Nocardiopsis sp. CNR-923]